MYGPFGLIVVILGAASVLALAAHGQPTGQVERGREVYQTRCALCHGDKGEGRVSRALIGADAGLGGYGTAKGLFDYVRKVMPADAPGRLLESEYWAVLAYILQENNLLPSGTTLGRETAPNILLQR